MNNKIKGKGEGKGDNLPQKMKIKWEGYII
jgi:hypothetical protein